MTHSRKNKTKDIIKELEDELKILYSKFNKGEKFGWEEDLERYAIKKRIEENEEILKDLRRV